jgi:hypothetical protein
MEVSYWSGIGKSDFRENQRYRRRFPTLPRILKKPENSTHSRSSGKRLSCLQRFGRKWFGDGLG